ncbi:conserved hypothetical protein [Desulfotalea psychrophila LSv54]|uniref:YkgJ family cysteine cluster protein n=2 Tax=Desulfotalea psychrophila TaxID=84980 RepID=Q6AQU3_DESPS|nr:conserved hypothetical protein [Desulfotalea psychrophila LSv54]
MHRDCANPFFMLVTQSLRSRVSHPIKTKKHPPIIIMLPPDSSIEQTSTWTKYNRRLCDQCQGTCCSLAVEVKASDLLRMEVTDQFELEENPKKIAKRLKKEGLIEHFRQKDGIFTLARMANGDCIYLHPKTRRCTIYPQRPDTCRNHPQVGPRPGYCAFKAKSTP